ncbi:polysaccharide deacetylase family protein [Natronorubrum sp. FCH18a]|uniref:polysaccharide deacetylase family protein n=1 Tax=Natronorubrum sp. FCH18a TaxID=3447018 RepID=UPI003F50E511
MSEHDSLTQKRRSIAPYLKFVRALDPAIDLDTRIHHILHDFFDDGIDRLLEDLEAAGVTAGFPVPAIYLEEDDHLREAIERIAARGHDLVVHGYRHTSYMETPYEMALEELTTARDALESVSASTPTGFHVPFMRASEGTVRAAEDAGLDWLLGQPPSETSTTLEVLDPVRPYDLQRLETGTAPRDAFERLTASATTTSVLLCHPNIHVHHDGVDAFAEILANTTFDTPQAVADGRADGPGLLLDCFPPFRVR